jgi:hypothetical protein
LLLEGAFHTSRAVAAAVGAFAASGVIAYDGVPGASPSRSNGDRQSLDLAIAGGLSGTLARHHSIIGGEVPADHVGFHGGAFHGELWRLVCNLGGILPVVHTHFTVIACAIAKGLVTGFGPLPAAAHTYSWKVRIRIDPVPAMWCMEVTAARYNILAKYMV